MSENGGEISNGLAILNEKHIQVLRRLDEGFLRIAKLARAREVSFPPLVPISSGHRVDYFKNFPHLGFAVCGIRNDRIPQLAATSHDHKSSIDSSLLENAHYMLPSAACYPIYEYLSEQTLSSLDTITTVQKCFRNEEHYDGYKRLLTFTMREIVAIGPRDLIKIFLAHHKNCIANFAEGAGIQLKIQNAVDPFFESGGPHQRMQQLFPSKEEFVFDGNLAISSVNFHRNFFSERWNIRTIDGQHAYSGCVAFGLERWLHALSCRHDDNLERMTTAIDSGLTLATQTAASVQLLSGQLQSQQWSHS